MELQTAGIRQAKMTKLKNTLEKWEALKKNG